MGVLLCVMLGGLGLNGMGGALEAGFFNDGLNLRSTEVGVRSFRPSLRLRMVPAVLAMRVAD